MPWRAELVGEPLDLQQMASTFSEGDPRVCRDEDGSYSLESTTFDALDGEAAVKTEAERLLTIMNGAMWAQDHLTVRSVQLSGQFRDPEDMVWIPATAEGRLTVTGAAVGTVNGVPVEPPPPAPAIAWLALAHSDPNVGDVLRLSATDDLDWFNLVKIMEVICVDVGGAVGAGKTAISKRRWAAAKQLRAFTASANNEKVSGVDAARHARTTGGVPQNVMTIAEGRALIHGLVRAWLTSKLNATGS
jgi:hypothetical protein